MEKLKLIRSVCIWVAFVLLFGGYAAHQWALIDGTLSEWTSKVSGPNLMIGWFFVVMSALLSLVKDTDKKEAN